MTNSYKIEILKSLYSCLKKEELDWHGGLCSIIDNPYHFRPFDGQWLLKYITRNRPKGASKNDYWWKRGAVNVRKQFVKNLIKNLEEKLKDNS